MEIQDKATIEARLAAVKAKRGYLLPHHALLALTSERLLEGYDAAYTALALDHKLLSVRDRETVWLAVLIAADEAIATHHIPKYLDGGGDAAGFEAIARLAAFAIGARAYAFVDAHWRLHLPAFEPRRAYAAGLLAAAAPLPPRVVWLAASAVHAALGDFTLLGWAIQAAYDVQLPERELAEALSIMMFPGSVPRFVEAANTWLALIREGAVCPSPPFAAWAELVAQGGYDEASGKR